MFKRQNHRNVFNEHEGKSIVTERFNRTLSNWTDKHLTAVSKNVYIDKLMIK